MKKIFFLSFVCMFFLIEISCAQLNSIENRFEGGESGFFTFIASNLTYPRISRENKTIGHSIAEITISPNGEILGIILVCKIDQSIDNEVIGVLRKSKNLWLKSETILTEQKFYVQIIFEFERSERLYHDNTLNEKFNFLDPIYITTNYGESIGYPETNENIKALLDKELKSNNYKRALSYLDELIRRYPFNIQLYQLRISIYRKLNKNDLADKDLFKIQNFIQGVSLIELTTTD